MFINSILQAINEKLKNIKRKWYVVNVNSKRYQTKARPNHGTGGILNSDSEVVSLLLLIEACKKHQSIDDRRPQSQRVDKIEKDREVSIYSDVIQPIHKDDDASSTFRLR